MWGSEGVSHQGGVEWWARENVLQSGLAKVEKMPKKLHLHPLL